MTSCSVLRALERTIIHTTNAATPLMVQNRNMIDFKLRARSTGGLAVALRPSSGGAGSDPAIGNS
jgi:hypothetical protein